MESEGLDLSFYHETLINPVGLAAACLLSVLILILPRRHAVLPIILMACFIAQGQNVHILGMAFYLMRILVIVGLVRVVARGETAGYSWNGLDTAVLAWAISETLFHTIQQGSFEALVNRLGNHSDSTAVYFLARCLIRDIPDVRTIAVQFAIVSVPVVIAFLVEATTGRNAFAAFGGVLAMTMVRDGRLRCQGAFAHPILAGCFFASVLPLIVAGLWRRGTARLISIVGIVCNLLIVVLCASSTPIAALMMGVIASAAFFVRWHMRSIRWGILFTLVALHLVMKAPVWALVARMDLVGGSTGYHRYLLIDAAIHRFGEWCFVGTTSTAEWGDGLQDVTNEYILQGVRGGVVTLGLFIAIVAVGFRRVGILWKSAGNRADLILVWALGVSFFIHCTNFIGVSYFGQIHIAWSLALAMIGSLRPAMFGSSVESKQVAQLSPMMPDPLGGLAAASQSNS